MALFQQMAIECLGPIPQSNRQFLLVPPENGIAFIQSSLIQHWKQQDYAVFLADSSNASSTSSLPVLTYVLEKSEVAYERLRKKQVKRDVRLTTHYTFRRADGQVEADDICTKMESDTLARSKLSEIESDAFPITAAPHPPKGWIKRYLEPVVLTTATVLGVYLFFTLRSDSNDDGT